MRWKTFQWIKFLFSHSSNYSRKLSQPKFHNELACVFTAHCARKDADWNQQQLMDGGILANQNSANHPYFFLSSQREVQILAFSHVICERIVSCPPPENRLQWWRDREWFRGSFFLANQLSKVAIHVWQTRVHFCSNVILPWKLRCLCLCCLVPARRLSRPSQSMHFGDVSETNGRETPRQSQSAHACAFLHFWKVHTVNWNNL